MKKLYIPENATCAAVIDTESDSIKDLRSEREAISRIYAPKEDMHLVYTQNGEQNSRDVKAGDIVVVFYDNTFTHRLIVVNSPEWTENIEDYNRREQERREQWAKEKGSEAEHECYSTNLQKC